MKVICNIHPFILMFCVEWNVELYYPNGFVDVFHIFIGNLVNDNTKMDLIIYYTYILCSYVLTRIMYLIIYLIFFNDFFFKDGERVCDVSGLHCLAKYKGNTYL